MSDGTDKDQDSKINDSVHQNHIPQINGFGPESGMSETEKQRNSPSVTYTSSSVLETYNTVVVTNSGFPTVPHNAARKNICICAHDVGAHAPTHIKRKKNTCLLNFKHVDLITDKKDFSYL
ncbi:phosphatase and actin regulator 2 [Trichonephila clavipes]|nr:phosphatase and actin regulator 2 [Trichonephila clavipes]